ncbi:GMC family oxidoreductase N-terminal domain-containing protein [Streptomyces griseochromogenes]
MGADGNGKQTEGVSWTGTNVVAGRRQSAADACLRPVLSRPNLTLITRAHVQRLVLDGTRCRGSGPRRIRGTWGSLCAPTFPVPGRTSTTMY